MKSANLPQRVALATALCASLVFPSMGQAQAQNEPLERSFCVFDPVGANGPLFAITKTFQPVALKNGIKLDLRRGLQGGLVRRRAAYWHPGPGIQQVHGQP